MSLLTQVFSKESLRLLWLEETGNGVFPPLQRIPEELFSEHSRNQSAEIQSYEQRPSENICLINELLHRHFHS